MPKEIPVGHPDSKPSNSKKGQLPPRGIYKMTPREKILKEIETERIRQMNKFSPDQDDLKDADDWCDNINGFSTWALQLIKMKKPEEYRKKIIQVAALAVACLESFDRFFDND